MSFNLLRSGFEAGQTRGLAKTLAKKSLRHNGGQRFVYGRTKLVGRMTGIIHPAIRAYSQDPAQAAMKEPIDPVESPDLNALQAELERLQADIGKDETTTEATIDEDAALAEMLKDQEDPIPATESKLDPKAMLPEMEVIVDGSASQMEFQAETRKLLDIVARSLYSDKEVFIRELISNASDALEKVRYRQLTGQDVIDQDIPLQISIAADGERTLTIQDSGIGMTRDELIENLGRIGHSGTAEYLRALATSDASNLIGQFGVGFYAIFMVAKRIRVYSRSATDTEDKGHVWLSEGTGSYSIAEATNVARGTKIVIELLDGSEEYAKSSAVEAVIKKYSNFVGFDIILNGTRVNTLKALWNLPPASVTEAEHREFYQFVAHAHDSPMYKLHYVADSPLNVRSLLYIPETHMEKYGLGTLEPGISLFTRKVLIQSKCKGLLPDWLRFVKGVVDSEDIPLNLSRETLQDSSIIRRLSNVLTRRILKFLNERATEDPVTYSTFYREFSQFLKQGICTDVKWKEDLAKLLRVDSSSISEQSQTTSLEEVAKRMREGQTEIYYLCVPSRTYAEASPYYEVFRRKGVEVIFLYATIDEFVMTNLAEFDGKKLVSIEINTAADGIKILPDIQQGDAASGGALGQSKDLLPTLSDAKLQTLLSWFREVLVTRVTTVVASERLVDSPAVVVDHESAAFRRMMRLVDPSNAPPTPPKIQLQINAKHPVIVKLSSALNRDPELARDVADQILDNAMIQAGLLDDNRAMVPRLSKILNRVLQSDD